MNDLNVPASPGKPLPKIFNEHNFGGRRVRYVATLGFRARRRWLKPFSTTVWRIEHVNGGVWQ